MTLTLILSKDEETRLQEKARRIGLSPADYVRQIIISDQPEPDLTSDPTYSSEWSEEDLRDATYGSLCRLDDILGPEDGNV